MRGDAPERHKGRDESPGISQTACSADASVHIPCGYIAPAFGQVAGDPQSLQTRSISRIDKWIDYVRRTGDAKSTVSELAAAQADLKTSLDLFLQQKDLANASLTVVKIGTIQWLQNQWQPAAQLYQAAIELAKRANRTDYQPRRSEVGTVGKIKDVPCYSANRTTSESAGQETERTALARGAFAAARCTLAA